MVNRSLRIYSLILLPSLSCTDLDMEMIVQKDVGCLEVKME